MQRQDKKVSYFTPQIKNKKKPNRPLSLTQSSELLKKQLPDQGRSGSLHKKYPEETKQNLENISQVQNPEETNRNRDNSSQKKDTNSSRLDKQTYSKVVESQINDLINQKYDNYSHNQATCVCPQCLCGKCVCKVHNPPKLYPRDLKSIYQQEFPWKEGDNNNQKNPSQLDAFKGDPYSLNKDSTYRQDYLPFQVQGGHQQPKKATYVKDNSPFYSLSQYKRDYLPLGAVRAIAMRPFDQLAQPAASDIPHLMDTTYRMDYKKREGQGADQDKEGRYKLHTNAQQPNLYMNTTYQNDFKKKEAGQRATKFGSGPTHVPFGYGDGLNYKSVYRDHYVPMEIRKCPARVVLEQICDHTLTKGELNPSQPAVSQILQKK